jgi:hypothetical protein
MNKKSNFTRSIIDALGIGGFLWLTALVNAPPTLKECYGNSFFLIWLQTEILEGEYIVFRDFTKVHLSTVFSIPKLLG